MKKLIVIIAALTVATNLHAESFVFLTNDLSFLGDRFFIPLETQEVHYRYALDLRLVKLNLGGGVGYTSNRSFQELCGEVGISRAFKQGNQADAIGLYARYGYLLNSDEYTIFSWDLLGSHHGIRRNSLFMESGLELKYYIHKEDFEKDLSILNIPFSIGVRF